MKILFMKKCFVGGRLYESGDIADVDDKTAELCAEIVKVIGKPEPVEEKVEKPAPKPIKPIKKAKK
jgi:hypothetical protein